MDKVDPVKKHEQTHGDFTTTAHVAQAMKSAVRKTAKWDGLPPVKREAIEMILTKIARMVCGDHTEPDHALDIEGYAKLMQGPPKGALYAPVTKLDGSST